MQLLPSKSLQYLMVVQWIKYEVSLHLLFVGIVFCFSMYSLGNLTLVIMAIIFLKREVSFYIFGIKLQII